MGEGTGFIFTIILFIVAFVGAGAYAVVGIADFRSARLGFLATAAIFAGLGVALGIMTTWPLPVRISISAFFAALAFGSLIWVLDYLKVRERLGVETTASQPDIILLPPTHTYKVTWNASSNLEISIAPIRRPEETEPLKTAVPAFQIKNIGSATAKSITIDWDARSIDLIAAVHNSERLKNFSVKFTDTHYGIFSGAIDDAKAKDSMKGLRGVTVGPEYKGYQSVYSQTGAAQPPYMAPEINNTAYQDAVLPMQITGVLELFIVATIVDYQPLASKVPLPPIFATVRWGSPENGKPARYRIDSVVINSKSWAIVDHNPVNSAADVDAIVEFTVTSVM